MPTRKTANESQPIQIESSFLPTTLSTAATASDAISSARRRSGLVRVVGTSAIEEARIDAVDELTIDPRFRGPDDSGNGGYTCGLVARELGGAAEVTLRLPPPLATPLPFDGVSLWSGDALVAEARQTDVDIELPAPVPWEDARAAAAPDVGSPFPHCFVCGYARAEGDGLRIFAGPVAGRDVVAAPWTPREGEVGPEFVWAALDCPGAYATGVPSRRGTVVLGRLAARVDRIPHSGEHCVVVGWSLGTDGRKHYAGTALHTAEGELLAVGRATWIEPRS